MPKPPGGHAIDAARRRLAARLSRVRRQISIRTRLFAAFGVFVALTVVACGVTWALFDVVDDTLSDVAEETLPAVTRAQNVAKVSADIAATGPALAAAESQAERADQMIALAGQRSALRSHLDRLRETGAQERLVDDLATTAQAMLDNLAAQDEAVEERLALAATLDARARAANEAYEAFQAEVTPVYDNAVASLYDSAEAARQRIAAALSGPPQDLDARLATWRRAETALVAARQALARGRRADVDAEAIAAARREFGASLATLSETVAAPASPLAGDLPTGRLAARLAGLQAAALGPGGVLVEPAASAATARQLAADLATLHEDLAAAVQAPVNGMATDGAPGQGVEQAVPTLVAVEVERVRAILEARLAAAAMISRINRVATVAPADSLEAHARQFRQHADTLYNSVTKLRDPAAADPIRNMLNQLRRQALGDLDGWRDQKGEVAPAMLVGDTGTIFGKRREILAARAEAQELADANAQNAEELDNLARALVRALQAKADRGVLSLQDAMGTGRWVLIGVIGASLLVAIIVGRVYVGKALVARIEHLAGTMRRIAEGDLAADIPREGNDEITQMADQVLVFRENTRRVAEANQRVRESEQRYALAIRGTSDGIWDWDRQNDRIYLSPRWKELLGFEPDALSDRPEEWWDRIHPGDRDTFGEALTAHLDGTTDFFEVEHRMRCKDGSWRWMLGRGMAVFDDQGWATRVAGSLADIQERKETEEQLRHKALYDELTDLPNRALFLDRVAMALHRSRRATDAKAAVMFIDLDRFKILNDSLGHQAGDELLVRVADRLQRCIRNTDTAARMGGDEFVVLVEGHSIDDLAQRVAERIQTTLKEPLTISGQEVFTTCSIGIAIASTESHTEPQDLLRDADAAMYEAKEQGRDRIALFSEQVRRRALHTLEMDTALRRALENGEIVPYFQPILSLYDRRIVGFETLARWHAPESGLVSPSQFIPLAEETGLVAEIGRQLMRQAIVHLRNWQALSKDLFVSINVSPQQWLEKGFAQEIDDALRENDVDPSKLRLEITESGMMRDYERMNESLRETGEMGLTQLLDDFGTGQSALAELLRMPLHGLKIDKSFVHVPGGTGVAQANIVRTIVALAHASDMYIVAEGVETDVQARELAAMACEYGQGFYFAKPMSAVDIETLLVRQLERYGTALTLDPSQEEE